MIYTELTKKAMKTAYDAHQGLVDKAGIPYIIHPILVAEMMEDEITTTVALLHDVVEDTPVTFQMLKESGFPEKIIEPLQLLTRDKEVDYMIYIDKISSNKIARKVKIADLNHNMDITRLDTLDEKGKIRVEKYKMAKERLEVLEEKEK